MTASSADASDVAAVLRELAWTIHRHAPERAGVGPIPTTETAILKEVVDAPGTTVGELVIALGLRQPNVSAALRSMIQRGLVSRETDASDRRVARIRATEAGLAEHAAVAAAWAGPVDTAIAELDPEARAALDAAAAALADVHANLRQRAAR